MSRWKAASLHLLLSVLVIGGVAAAGFLLWYPHGLYRVAEFDRILWIMFGVDLVAGPLLTLAVYRHGKRGMVFDLWVIALCQCVFFGYGVSTLWQSRPVFLVASEVRFNLVFANEIEPEQLAAAANPEWRRFSWAGPRLVAVQPPVDEAKRQELLFAYFQTGIDLHQLPELYVEPAKVWPRLSAQAEPIEDSPLRRVPVVSRYGDAWLVIDPRNDEIVRTEHRIRH